MNGDLSLKRVCLFQEMLQMSYRFSGLSESDGTLSESCGYITKLMLINEVAKRA